MDTMSWTPPVDVSSEANICILSCGIAVPGYSHTLLLWDHPAPVVCTTYLPHSTIPHPRLTHSTGIPPALRSIPYSASGYTTTPSPCPSTGSIMSPILYTSALRWYISCVGTWIPCHCIPLMRSMLVVHHPGAYAVTGTRYHSTSSTYL
jgi:hypothetical protein